MLVAPIHPTYARPRYTQQFVSSSKAICASPHSRLTHLTEGVISLGVTRRPERSTSNFYDTYMFFKRVYDMIPLFRGRVQNDGAEVRNQVCQVPLVPPLEIIYLIKHTHQKCIYIIYKTVNSVCTVQVTLYSTHNMPTS
jgi:hypothetical protein